MFLTCRLPKQRLRVNNNTISWPFSKLAVLANPIRRLQRRLLEIGGEVQNIYRIYDCLLYFTIHQFMVTDEDGTPKGDPLEAGCPSSCPALGAKHYAYFTTCKSVKDNVVMCSPLDTVSWVTKGIQYVNNMLCQPLRLLRQVARSQPNLACKDSKRKILKKTGGTVVI